MIDWPLSAPVPIKQRPPRVQASASFPDGEQSEILNKLRKALDAIPNDAEQSLDYDQWFRVVCGIHHACEGSSDGLALAEIFSGRSPKHDSDFLGTRVWPYVTSERDSAVTARTVFAMARQHGYIDDGIEDFEVLDNAPAEHGKTVETAPRAVLAQGANGTEILGSNEGNRPAGKQPKPGSDPKRVRFAVLDESQLLSRPRPRWLVKGVIPQADLGVIYGESGAGKSFVALDLFGCVARGVDWRGHRCSSQHRVVYVAAEGAGGFRNRVEAYCIELANRTAGGDISTGLRVIVDAPNLLKDADLKPLVEQIQIAGGTDVIVIDTLAQVSPGGDENSAEDMGAVLLNCRRLRKATGAMIVLIHHAGKDLSRGARGWSGLKAAADFELEVRRDDDKRWLRVSKLKDGEDGAEFHFRLLPVTVGTDEDGDVITSCVVEHVEGEPRQRNTGPKGRLEKIILKTAQDLCDLGDEGVPVSVLIEDIARREPYDPSSGRDRRREIVRRALGTVVSGGWLRLLDNVVTMPGGSDE